MNDQATATARAIEVDYDLAYPPEKVWRTLTEPDLLAKWLMPNDIAPRVGHRFTFQTDPVPAAGFDGVVHCEVLVVEKNRRISYAWRGGQIDTVVTWTLTATATGTRLHLEHAGFWPRGRDGLQGPRRGLAQDEGRADRGGSCEPVAGERPANGSRC